MSIKRVAPHLPVGDHVDPRLGLRFERFVDGAVLETLELERGDLCLLIAAARLRQVGRAQQAADHLALRLNGVRRKPGLHTYLYRVTRPSSRSAPGFLRC